MNDDRIADCVILKEVCEHGETNLCEIERP